MYAHEACCFFYPCVALRAPEPTQARKSLLGRLLSWCYLIALQLLAQTPRCSYFCCLSPVHHSASLSSSRAFPYHRILRVGTNFPAGSPHQSAARDYPGEWLIKLRRQSQVYLRTLTRHSADPIDFKLRLKTPIIVLSSRPGPWFSPYAYRNHGCIERNRRVGSAALLHGGRCEGHRCRRGEVGRDGLHSGHAAKFQRLVCSRCRLLIDKLLVWYLGSTGDGHQFRWSVAHCLWHHDHCSHLRLCWHLSVRACKCSPKCRRPIFLGK